MKTGELFTIVANVVAQKTKEVGIPLVLGSTVCEASIEVGVPGARAAMVGLAIGLTVSAGAL